MKEKCPKCGCTEVREKLILIDTAESALYELQQEFIQKGIKNFIAIVADVRDKVRMESLFNIFMGFSSGVRMAVPIRPRCCAAGVRRSAWSRPI